MTVLTEQAANSYLLPPGNTQQVFDYTFRLLDEEHLFVTLDNQVVTSGYTVSGVGDNGGGQVTFGTAPAGSLLAFYRDIPVTQEVDYVAYDKFPAETHETALDKLTMILQDLQFAEGNFLAAPPGYVGSLTLPYPEAGKALGWANDLLSIVNLDITGTGGGGGDTTILVAQENGFINGGCQIWQRGFTYLVTVGSYHRIADQWLIAQAGMNSSISVSREISDLPLTIRPTLYAIRCSFTATDNTVGIDDHTGFAITMEGTFFKKYFTECTVSFWVKCSVQGQYGVSFRNDDHDYSYLTSFTIDGSNVGQWARHVMYVPFYTADPAKFKFNFDRGVVMNIELCGGSNRQDTPNDPLYADGNPGVWTTSAVGQTPKAVIGNGNINQAGAQFFITNLKMEVGRNSDPEFIDRSFAQELALCQRYYYKTFDYNQTPAQRTDVSSGALSCWAWKDSGTPFIRPAVTINFPVAMRPDGATTPNRHVELMTVASAQSEDSYWSRDNLNGDGFLAAVDNVNEANLTVIGTSESGDSWANNQVNWFAAIHMTVDVDGPQNGATS